MENTAILSAIVSGVISFFLGGGLIAYLKFKRDGRNDDRSFAEGERARLLAQVDVLNNAVSSLSARLVPTNFPLWIKDANRKYIDVNASWELQIGGRLGMFKSEVYGKTDEEIFRSSPELAELFSSMDNEAVESGGIAVRIGVSFPKDPKKKIVVKEVVIHDIFGQPIFKGMAFPDTSK
jgi:hypothetical protein